MQNILDEFAKSVDPRTSLFDVRIDSETNGTLTLSGRVLDKSQLDELPRILPNRKLDTSSIRVLNTETHPQARVHVATNLTGLYGKPTFGMPLSSELYYGTELEVLDEKGRWVFTRQRDGYLGWAYRPYLKNGNSLRDVSHFILTPTIELREEPDEGSTILTRLVSGTAVVLNDEWEDWSLINANKTGWVPSKSLRTFVDIPTAIETKQALMLNDAMRMIGVPYLWGGTSDNGIDCSGFARLLYRWIGIDIPRDADMQHAAAKPAEPPFEVGDLLFFCESDRDQHITHVGMSLGGWKMIHSSRSRNGVYIDDVQEVNFLKEVFVSAGSFLK
ncbi:MAG: NlpC/P60 family protein [Anaerolineae bacterium]|nr:NlpC/P60 family protein [Anaerolineae bacterium]MCI0609974.1 NlpC/P60 family protein [Anaerolineae bacterium]